MISKSKTASIILYAKGVTELAFENTRAEFWKRFFKGPFRVLVALVVAVLPEIRL